jgi:L-cysteine:1D-myo-inositol 2-amino-2-deoxy-alpha-D-glucopyranoside ligase
MRSWSAPDVPSTVLDRYGPGPPVAVFDSLSEQRRETSAGDQARLYVCGITPYDATHLGHALTYLTFDLLIRAWLAAGVSVRYVQNVTDIDDPLLARAQRTGVDWVKLAEEQTDLFRADMEGLGAIPPDVYAGAVESVPIICDLIETMERRGAVYQVDQDRYFDVTTDRRFGELGRLDLDEQLALFAERGGDPDRLGKRHPLDCLVWMRQRPDEPGWNSPFGPGRPGWHVECTAIAREYLGTDFDVQGGGMDLVFPHHEMSASHARVADPEHDFAQAYVHAGMLGYAGHKMSKSRGNLVLVSQLRTDGVDSRVIRLALLSHHYQESWDWTDEQLTHARERLARWELAVARGGADPGRTVKEVREAMADDLDAPTALTAVDSWANDALGRAASLDQARAANANATVIADLVSASLGVSLDPDDSSGERGSDCFERR